MNDGKLNGSNYNEIGDNEYSYGPILARMIGAEYSVIAKSGQGVAVNYTERPPFTMPHAADLYNWAFFIRTLVKIILFGKQKNYLQMLHLLLMGQMILLLLMKNLLKKNLKKIIKEL